MGDGLHRTHPISPQVVLVGTAAVFGIVLFAPIFGVKDLLVAALDYQGLFGGTKKASRKGRKRRKASRKRRKRRKASRKPRKSRKAKRKTRRRRKK